LVRAQAGRGRYVAEASHNGVRSQVLVDNWLHEHQTEIDHLCEIRAAIEGAALAGMPKARRAALAARLEPIVAAARAMVAAGEHDRAAELDAEFHLTLCSETDNGPLRDLVRGLVGS